SYQGDFIWYEGPPQMNDDTPPTRQPTAKRSGSFICPTSKMKSASELLLFYETRFCQAYLATQETADMDPFQGNPAITVLDIPGWHGKLGEYSVSFCDGSARRIKLLSKGFQIDAVREFNPGTWPYFNSMWRGNGTNWRYDNFPYSDNGPNLSDWPTEFSIGNRNS